MKKLILFSLLLAFLPSAFAQTTSKSKSKSDKPRNWAELSSLSNGQKYDKSQARVFTANGYVHWKEMSLKSFDREKLNNIELDLMDRYDDVVVTRMFKCYFIIDEYGRIGIADMSGNELVPPVEGNIRPWGVYFLVGDVTDDFSDIKTQPKYDVINSSYSVAYPMGLCKSVVTYMGNGVFPIVPYGEYDYVSPIPTMGVNGVRGFYVYKVDENGNKVWGYYDKKGKEVIPCEYKSIVYNGKSFSGSNTASMDDVMKKYENVINMETALREQRAQMWSSVLGAVGEAMIGVGTAMQQSQSSSAGVSAGDSSSKASGGVDYLAQYRRWERLAERHYNSITNLGTSVKYDDGSKSGSAGQSMGPATYTSMKKSYREAQQEMARIRREAAQAGVSIPQSPWETNTISY